MQSLSECLKWSGGVFWGKGAITEIKYSHEVWTLVCIHLRVWRKEVLTTNLLSVDSTEIYPFPPHYTVFLELKHV